MKVPPQKWIIILGLGLVVLGFGLHTEGALCTWNSYYYEISPGGTSEEVLPIMPKFGEDSVDIHFYVWSAKNLENVTVVLVNESEYEKFHDGSSITELVVLASFDLQSTLRYNGTEFTTIIALPARGVVYLIFWNQNSVVFPLSLSLSITTPLYFVGLVVAACGTICVLATLAWTLSGWKRYLIIGCGINIAVFFTRVAMYTTYDYPISTLSDILSPEMYNDFEGWYTWWIKGLFGGGVNLANLYSPATGYIYPPLFLFTLVPFAILPLPFWRFGIPLFMANIATGYFVFQITRKLRGNERGATWAMMLYYLNPFTLLYGSFLWLNPTLFVCFVTLAFYLAFSGKIDRAMLVLGIATMFKQFAVIFFPLLLIIALKSRPSSSIRGRIKDILKLGARYAMPIALISLPFLLLNAPAYINAMLFRNVPDLINSYLIYPISDGSPIKFTSFFLWVGIPVEITTILAYFLRYFVFLGCCAIIIFGSFWHYSKHCSEKSSNSDQNTNLINRGLVLAIILIISVQVFFPRGSYKFYLILLAPFISICYDACDFAPITLGSQSNSKFRWQFLLPTLFSWIIFWCNRYLYFPLLLGWALYYVVKLRKVALQCRRDAVPLRRFRSIRFWRKYCFRVGNLLLRFKLDENFTIDLGK